MTQAPSNLATILLVEDDPADAYLIRAAFKENHILANLKHVLDGVEALAYVRGEGAYANEPRPDLILLDLNMPRMDGRQFLGEIKDDEDLSAIPVVILTTSDVERDMLATYRLGAAGYIVKPVDVDHFIQIVRGLEDYWFSLVRLP